MTSILICWVEELTLKLIFIMVYSDEEKIWVVKKFYEVQNCTEVQRQWRLQFANDPPSLLTIKTLVLKFEEHGKVQSKTRNAWVLTPQNINLIEERVRENPHLSTRQASAELNLAIETAIPHKPCLS